MIPSFKDFLYESNDYEGNSYYLHVKRDIVDSIKNEKDLLKIIDKFHKDKSDNKNWNIKKIYNDRELFDKDLKDLFKDKNYKISSIGTNPNYNSHNKVFQVNISTERISSKEYNKAVNTFGE